MALGSQGAQKVIVMQELTACRFQVYHLYSVPTILLIVTPISFLKKSYIVSCLLRFERFVFKNQPARELLIGVTEHELHELHEYVA